MRKTMNIWVLIAMSACVLVAFFWYSGTLSQTIDELNDTYDQTQMRLTQLQGDQADPENPAGNRRDRCLH